MGNYHVLFLKDVAQKTKESQHHGGNDATGSHVQSITGAREGHDGRRWARSAVAGARREGDGGGVGGRGLGVVTRLGRSLGLGEVVAVDTALADIRSRFGRRRSECDPGSCRRGRLCRGGAIGLKVRRHGDAVAPGAFVDGESLSASMSVTGEPYSSTAVVKAHVQT